MAENKKRRRRRRTRVGKEARSQWFTPVLLATWEVETGRIVVPSQLRKKKFKRFHLNREKKGMVRCTSYPTT
jgi:hypothetical protein